MSDSPLLMVSWASVDMAVAQVTYPPGLYDQWPLPGHFRAFSSWRRWHGVIWRQGNPVEWVLIDGCQTEDEAMTALRRHWEVFVR